MDENTYLIAIENAHKRRTFCYVATQWLGDHWRISIAERYTDGHFPLSEDFFLGSEQQAQNKAADLNLERLGIGALDAAEIVASTMRGSLDDRRRR